MRIHFLFSINAPQTPHFTGPESLLMRQALWPARCSKEYFPFLFCNYFPLQCSAHRLHRTAIAEFNISQSAHPLERTQLRIKIRQSKLTEGINTA